MTRILKALWHDNRGLATSLMEVSLVLAITAVISSVAIGLSSDQINNADIQGSNGELKLMGVSVLSFIQDTGFAPAFKKGNASGPGNDYFKVLETAGNDPVDLTHTWPDASTRDSLANQLSLNNPGASGVAYLRVGEIDYARFKGWNGPYMSKFPAGDPWGSKYLVNIGLATTQGAQTLNLATGRRPAVVVICAGPNQVLETPYAQAADEFVAGGDDTVFRIQ